MKLIDILNRQTPPPAWGELKKIPWNAVEFSQRMLKEHLSQAHDAASRRSEIINCHIQWIHEQILGGQAQRVLDLGCGPGLYTQRLAQLGHPCSGIDFSPAAVEYARMEAEKAGLSCSYVLDDLAQADFGQDYDLVMFIYGEFNTFPPEEARQILHKARGALKAGGKLLLELSQMDPVRRRGEQASSWYTAAEGLMSAEAHICLKECFWDETAAVTTERYYVIDAGSGNVTQMNSVTQVYTDDRLKEMLEESGFSNLRFFEGLGGVVFPGQEEMFAVLAW